jgi:hypothetical protein
MGQHWVLVDGYLGGAGMSGMGKPLWLLTLELIQPLCLFLFFVCQRQLLFCFEVLLSVCERHLLVRGWMGVSLSVHDSIESGFIMI